MNIEGELQSLECAMLSFFRRINDNKFMTAIRNGMVMAIPVVMTGVFAILLNSLPIPVYQHFIQTAGGGVLPRLFRTLSGCTVDVFALILLITVSYSYEKLLEHRRTGMLTLVSLCAYIALVVDLKNGFSMAMFDKTRLLEAILVAFFASRFYLWLSSRKIFDAVSYSEGADSLFNAALSSIFPVAIVTVTFAAVNLSIF